MGNILGKIYDDEERYESLCKKYGEEPHEVYSDHYQWITRRHLAETPDSFSDYIIPKRIEKVKAEIKALEEESRNVNLKLANKRAELIRLEKNML